MAGQAGGENEVQEERLGGRGCCADALLFSHPQLCQNYRFLLIWEKKQAEPRNGLNGATGGCLFSKSPSQSKCSFCFSLCHLVSRGNGDERTCFQMAQALGTIWTQWYMVSFVPQ